jgi:hypothetical protein
MCHGDRRPSVDKPNLAWPPGLEWLKRAVKAQERAPPFAWNGLFFQRGHRQQTLSQGKDLDGSIASADLDISDRHRVGAV